MERIGPVAYRLDLPIELSSIHDTFHVSNLKKCLSEETVVLPLEEIQIDEQLRATEEPIEILDREIKQLRRSKIPIVKVRWNSRHGPWFTWERDDGGPSNHMKDPLVIREGPITRSRAKLVNGALMSIVAEIQVKESNSIEDAHVYLFVSSDSFASVHSSRTYQDCEHDLVAFQIPLVLSSITNGSRIALG
ncbi:hypothetical protein OSB04_un000185 [Centaurea solstitialis]|uniref:Tf2-1-like SH3-like domain-containing protein n=1 Tax=Centaurea solstitialis TaxID=347529 RepID=A0AA38SHV6_9ASTR|nr:hypothetical protein OSB04_un000185 [Centaurea solstitialis]